MSLGLVHIYTGDGKGKTSCATGLATRCAGYGNRVRFIQFLKATPSGELNCLLKLGIELLRANTCEKFFFDMSDEEKLLIKKQTMACLDSIYEKPCDMLVLDEIFCLLYNGIISKDDVIRLIKLKPPKTELVLTGFGAPQELFEYADYVSEIKCVKHPYNKGTNARSGVDF